MNDNALLEMENLFLALSDRTRLQLLSLIGSEEVSVGYLCEALAQSQPKISRHLAYLRSSGLVSTRREGKWIFYKIALPHDQAGQAVLRNALKWASGDNGPVTDLPAASVPAISSDGGQPTIDYTHFIPNEIEVHLL
jgi:ArsR family transcriptional regulator